jgi:fermentation-respiration switch protein FrsA (DUF1100 family)
VDRLRSVLYLVLALAGSYALLCLILFAFPDRFVYFPGPPPRTTPDRYGLAFDDLELETEDGERLHAWRIRTEGERRGLVLHCHGNAGSIEFRIAAAQAFVEAGFDCLLFDYRGYGKSTGSSSEDGTYLDAEAAYDWSTGPGGYAAREIVVFGESLGGAVGVELALRREVASIALESSFTSLADIGADVYPWLPIRLLAGNRYPTIDRLPRLSVPVLVLHGRRDGIIPFEHGERLARAVDARLLELPGGHNDGGFVQRADLRRAVAEFFAASVASGLRSDEATE